MRNFLYISALLSLISINAQSHPLNINNHNDAQNIQQAGPSLAVEVEGAWARATFALAKTGAAYMSLQNNGEQDIRLTSVSVDESIASISELHHTVMRDDMMSMQELEDGIVIAAGETVEFAPGGKHIMLMGLTGPLEAGKQIEVTLNFDNGTNVSHIFPIKDAR